MSPKVIVKGKAHGIVMKSSNPINFLGAVDKKTGIILDDKHELFQKSIKDVILVFPHGVGSSVGAYTIFSLKSYGSAPSAMICTKADLSVVSGCAIANIPLMIISKEQFDSLQQGKEITVDTKTGRLS